MNFYNLIIIIGSIGVIRASSLISLGDSAEDLTVEVKGSVARCSGVLYKPNLVLTASSCVYSFMKDHYVTIHGSENSTTYRVDLVRFYNGFDNIANSFAILKINRTSDSQPLLYLDQHDYASVYNLNFSMISRNVYDDNKKYLKYQITVSDIESCDEASSLFQDRQGQSWSARYKHSYNLHYAPYRNPKTDICSNPTQPDSISKYQVFNGSPLFLDVMSSKPILVGINLWGRCDEISCSPFIFSRMSFMDGWIRDITRYWDKLKSV